MKLPRDLSGAALEKSLGKLGYQRTRKTGSHSRLTTSIRGEHHVTVPDHKVPASWHLKAILRDVSGHLNCTIDDVAERLFGSK